MCLCAFVVIPVSMIRPQRNDEFEMLTPDIVSEALTKAGILITPKDLEVEAREDKWLVRLPGQQLAWFAMSDEARARLRDERRLLQLLGRRCTFGVPRVPVIPAMITRTLHGPIVTMIFDICFSIRSTRSYSTRPYPSMSLWLAA